MYTEDVLFLKVCFYCLHHVFQGIKRNGGWLGRQYNKVLCPGLGEHCMWKKNHAESRFIWGCRKNSHKRNGQWIRGTCKKENKILHQEERTSLMNEFLQSICCSNRKKRPQKMQLKTIYLGNHCSCYLMTKMTRNVSSGLPDMFNTSSHWERTHGMFFLHCNPRNNNVHFTKELHVMWIYSLNVAHLLSQHVLMKCVQEFSSLDIGFDIHLRDWK